MYYLIGIKKGVHPCGNDGTLITRYKSEYKRRETAQRFATIYNLDEVFGLQVYSQRLCKMEPAEFVDYIRRNCKRYV